MFLQLIVAAAILFVVACANPAKAWDSRVVGGAPTTIEDYPYIVSLSLLDGQFCAGSIIDHFRILTAAHCIWDLAQNNSDYYRYIQVRVGSTYRNSGGVLHSIRRAHIHANFNNTQTDDVAVIILNRPIIYTSKSQPIAVPSQGQNAADNQTVYAAGWGTEEFGNPTKPDILRAVAVQIVNQEVCKNDYADGIPYSIVDESLCAGIQDTGGKDTCQGDSGGPLAEVHGLTRIIWGITSWGNECALPNYPGIYTRVSYYADWINLAR